MGVSFIATPAKFLAITPSRSELLEVGQVTFNTFVYVEIVFFILLAFSVIKATGFSQVVRLFLLSIVVILFVQYGLLLPQLDDRVNSIMQGVMVEPSNHHLFYVLLECAKVLILLMLGIVIGRNTSRTESHAIV